MSTAWERLEALGLPIPRGLVPHQPSERCATNTHCYSCHVDEPDLPGDFRVCGECCHVFRTEQDLVDATARLYAELEQHEPAPQPLPVVLALLLGLPTDQPPAEPTPRVAPTSGDQIFTCPACAHDF